MTQQFHSFCVLYICIAALDADHSLKQSRAENFWQEWNGSNWAWCVCWYVFRAGCVRGWPALFPLPALTAAGKQMFTTVINAFYSCILSKVEICCDMGSARTRCGFSRHNININIFQQLITSDMNGAWFSVARATLHDTWPGLLYYFFCSAKKLLITTVSSAKYILKYNTLKKKSWSHHRPTYIPPLEST